MVIDSINTSVIKDYFEPMISSGILQSTLFRLSFFTLTIIVYSLFVFYSYKLFSKKNLFDFNFSQYLNTEHPTATSIFGFFVYLLEYLIVLPFFVIIWFSFYAIFLMILARNLDISTILLVCTALISAIRISSFTSQSLSQDLAKMLPFTLLALALMGERFFSIDLLLERLYSIPALLSALPIYFLFILCIEIVFRLFDAVKIFIFKE